MNFATRFAKKGEPYEGLAYRNSSGAHWTGEVRFIEEHLADPLKVRKSTKWFVNSMSDLFHEGVSDQQITDIFGIMALAHWHTFQVLTKRPQRMLEYLRAGDHGIINQFKQIQRGGGIGPRLMFKALDMKRRDRVEWQWPLPNVHMGVSVEDQETADQRIPFLLETPAAIRWVSAEPLLGPIDLDGFLTFEYPHCAGFVGGHAEEGYCTRCHGHLSDRIHTTPSGKIDWVVVGGESGPGARSMNIEWARSIVAQCNAARVPVFVKQLGAIPFEPSKYQRTGDAGLNLKNKKGGDISEWPEDLRVREFPQVEAAT
jgi:protein gp37